MLLTAYQTTGIINQNMCRKIGFPHLCKTE
jgi:hypothetical protein